MKKAILLCLLALLSPSLPWHCLRAEGVSSSAPQIDGKAGVVSGLVVDSSGQPVIGASVVQKGTRNGTVTDVDGSFSLTVPQGTLLVFSSIGYKDVEQPAAYGMKVVLPDDVNQLEEVVVVGYGTMKKKDLTGSISQVRTEQMEKEAPRSVTDLLRGGVAGLTLSMSTNAAGTADIQIRGKNTLSAGSTPLYVLDGVIYSGALTDINANDIESIDVLKDASSVAIYGAKAASGVIAITTKRGSEGKPRVSFNTNIGLTRPSHLPKMVDGQGFIDFRKEYYESTMSEKELQEMPSLYSDPRTLSGVDMLSWYNYTLSQPVTTLPDQNALVGMWLSRLNFSEIEVENYLNGIETDWDSMLFQTGLQQDYTVSVSNRNEKSSYYASLGYVDRQGAISGSGYNNVRGRINLDAYITKWLTIGTSTQLAVRKGGYLEADLDQREKLSPYTTNEIDDLDSIYRMYPNGDNTCKNPFFDNFYRDRREFDYDINMNVYALVKLPFGWEYQANYAPRMHWYEYFDHKSSQNPSWAGNGGESTRTNTHRFNWQFDNILRWKQEFGSHRFELTLLYNAEKNQSWSTTATNKQYTPSDVLSYHAIKAGADPTVDGEDTYDTGDALMARLFYSYKNKYLLTASVRRDGYSAFGQANPRATFPSVALGWVFTNEKFMQNVNWLNYGKLRLSYGINGNRDIGRYAALAQLKSGLYTYIDNGNYYLTSQILINTMGNRELRWEKTAAWNAGLDFALFDNRLDGAVELYKSTTTDLLVDRTLPDITGFSSIKANLGELANHGFELTLNAHPVRNANFKWDTGGTFYFNRRKIVHLYGDMEDVYDDEGNVIGQKESDDTTNGWYIGHDPNQIYDYVRDGVWQLGEEEAAAVYGNKPGDFRYIDQDDNKVLNTLDKVFQGYTTPRYQFSWRNEFTFWKDLSLSFSLYGKLGHYGTYNRAANSGSNFFRYTIPDLERWTVDNPTNDYGRIGSVNKGNNYVRKDFARMENITLSYNLPKPFLQRIGIESARVSLALRNPFVLTQWEFGDVEGADYTMKSLNLGINLTL